MKRFWMATAAAALSIGSLVVVGATPANADEVIAEFQTMQQCQSAKGVHKLLDPSSSFDCHRTMKDPGVYVWQLLRVA